MLDLTLAELEILRECLDTCEHSNANGNAIGMGNIAMNAARNNAMVALSDKVDAAKLAGNANEGGGRRRRKSRKTRKGRK